MRFPRLPRLSCPAAALPPEERLTATNPTESHRKLEKVYWLCRKNRRGTSAVEFALIAPWFFMLIFGMLEFGRAVMVQQMITNASREGARIAILDGATTPQVQTAVQSYLTASGIAGTTVTVDPNPPSNAGFAAPVTVSVSVPFGQVSWVPLPKIPFTSIDLKTKTLQATTVMRRETVQ